MLKMFPQTLEHMLSLFLVYQQAAQTFKYVGLAGHYKVEAKGKKSKDEGGHGETHREDGRFCSSEHCMAKYSVSTALGELSW